MKVGFSGSRQGMTGKQYQALEILLQALRPTVFHHGSCRGADAESHVLVNRLCPGVIRHAHPANTGSWRAHLDDAELTHPVKAPLDRNMDIVAAAEVMVCCPDDCSVGTKWTIRHAVQSGKRTIVIDMEGNTKEYPARQEEKQEVENG